MERVMKYLQGDYSGVVVGISILVIVLVHYLIKSLLCDQNQGNLPPGPPSWPIIGHLHLLTKDRPAHHTLHSLSQTYGPIMFLRFGSRPVLVVTSSDLARECLTTNDRIFASRPRYAATDHLGYNSTLLGLDPYDHRCRNLRRICKSEILSPARIEMSRHGRSEEISKSVRSLFESAGDEKVDMRSRLLELNFNLIMRVVTDKRYLGNEEEVAEFENMIKENSLLLGAFNVGDYIPWLRWMDLQGFERAMKKLSRRRDEFMQRVVDEHRQRKEESEGNRDLMDVLLSLVEKGEDYCNNDSIVKATAMERVTLSLPMATMASLLLMASVPHPPPLRNGFLLATRQYVISAFPNSTEKKFSNRKAVIVSAQSSDSSWEREEARWLREDKRWLREEERWLKEEARWNAQRQALEDEIESLRGHIRVLQEQSQTSMIKEEASLSDLITSLTRFLQSLDGVDASVTRISSNPQVQISSSASSLNDFDSLLKRGSSGEPSGESLSFDGKPTERPQNKVGRNVSVGVDLKDGINAKQTVKSTPTAEKKKKRNLRRGSEGEDVKEMQVFIRCISSYK